jgi:hypothetical protein
MDGILAAALGASISERRSQARGISDFPDGELSETKEIMLLLPGRLNFYISADILSVGSRNIIYR